MNNSNGAHNDLFMNEDDGKLYFNPYNSRNREISESEIEDILYLHLNFKYKINNYDVFKRAFIHRSYCKLQDTSDSNVIIMSKPDNCLPLRSKSNERLEFLGDGVLELITKYYLYTRFPKGDEGFMTEKKIAIVKNEHIGQLAQYLNLQRYYIISNHAEEKNIRTNVKKLGCLFEAFLGALFLDANKIPLKVLDTQTGKIDAMQSAFSTGCGFQVCQVFLHTVFERYVDWNTLIGTNDNYKNNFQVILQKEFKTTPEYIILEQGDDNSYTMGVFLVIGYENTPNDVSIANDFKSEVKTFENIHNRIETDGKVMIFFAKGTHKTKKKAEQIACETAIGLLP